MEAEEHLDTDTAAANQAEAGDWLEDVARTPVTELDVVAVGVRQKAPFLVLCLREGLLWRVAEMVRSPTSALERGEEASGITLARCVMEAAAMMWRVCKLVENRAEYGPGSLEPVVIHQCLGSKYYGKERYTPINALMLIDYLEKAIPRVKKLYDQLSDEGKKIDAY